MTIKIAVLDDDFAVLEQIDEWFKKDGIKDYDLFDDVDVFFNKLSMETHMVIVDYMLKARYDGLDVIDHCLRLLPHAYYGLITGMEDFKMAVRFNHLCMRGKLIPKWRMHEDNSVTRLYLIDFIHDVKRDMVLIRDSYKDIQDKLDSMKLELDHQNTTLSRLDKFFDKSKYFNK